MILYSGVKIGTIPDVAKVGEVVRRYNMLKKGSFDYYEITRIVPEENSARADSIQEIGYRGYHWEVKEGLGLPL